MKNSSLPLSTVTRATILTTSLGLAVASLISAPVHAAILTWDVSPGTVGAGNGAITGGTGAWNTTGTLGNWTADGGATNVAWVNNTPPDEAIFGGTGGNVTQSGVTVNKMTFNVAGYSILSNTLTLAGSLPGITTNADVGIFCTVTGTEGLTKHGSGALNLFNRATYTGGTIINSGVLSLNGGGGATGAIRGVATVNSGATLRLNTGDATGYNTGTDRVDTINLNGGTLDISVINNQTLGSAVINMTGGAISGIPTSNLDFFVNGSAVNSLAAATPSTINGVKLSIRQTPGLTFAVADGAAPIDLDVGSEVANNSGFAAAPLIKTGAGTMRLSGLNTHTGTTIVNGGTLALSGGSAIIDTGTVVLANTAGATLRVDTSETIGTLTGGGSTGGMLDLQANTLTVSALADSNFAGALAGSGNLVKEGTNTLTLSGASTFNGTVTANTGTLNLTGSLTNSTLSIADGAFVRGEGSATSILLGSGGGADLLVDPSTPGALTATGALTVAGTTYVTLNGPLTGSSVKVVEFASNPGGFNAADFALAAPGNFRPGASFTVNPTNVTLNYARKSVEWTAANDNIWETAGTVENFRDTGTLGTESFFTADDVLFGDLPGSHQTIDVPSAVAPSVMTVNSNYNYTFSGSPIGGGAVLTKAGSGTLTLAGANTFANGILLRQGTLIANNATALGAASNSLVLGDASTGANPLELKIDTGVTGTVALGSITTSNFGTSQTITLNSGSALGGNAGVLATNLNLAGSTPVTVKSTNTGGHGSAQDFDGRITGTGIPAGTTALVFDGNSNALRFRPQSGTSAACNFTGDVVMKGAVTTEGRTYNGQIAENQNLHFLNNDVTVESGSWTLVWGGETCGALKGAGAVVFNNQNSINGIGLTLGNNNRSGSHSGNISGGFGLAKTGSGSQILSGNLTYTGPTRVNAGLLQIPSGVTLTGGITVSDNATLTVASGNGPSLTTNNLTLGATTGATLEVKNFTSNLTAPAVNATAALTANGTITIKVGGAFATGTFPLIDYVTRSGTAVFQLDTASLPRGVTATLVEDPVNTRLNLVISTSTPLVWVGDKGTQWDIATTQNWKLGGIDASYLENDQVLFDDSATGSGTVAITGTVNPSSMTFANTIAKPFTLGGGTIGGSAALMKTGDGLLTITGSHSFSGTTTVSAGTLNLGDGSTNGTVGGAIVNNAAVNFNTLGSVNHSGGFSGSGIVRKREAGTLVLTGSISHTGNVEVENGTLQIGNVATTDYGAIGRIRGPVTIKTGATLTCVGNNIFGYTVGSKVNQVDIVGGVYTHSGSGDNGWGVTYNLTGGTMQTTDANGRISFGGPSAANSTVNTLASATTSILAGRANLRSENSNSSFTFTVADGAAATDFLVSALIYGNSVNIVKAGPGLMAMGGANTYNGTTTVSGGTIRLDHQLALQNSTLTTGGVTFGPAVVGNAFTLGGLQGAGSIDLQTTAAAPVELTVGNNGANTLPHTGVISGPGSLVKTGAGTLTLQGANTYTGNTTVNQGILSITDDFADTSTVSIASGAKLQLNTAAASDTVQSLILGGTPMGSGTYNATTHPAFFSGTGSLVVAGAAGFNSWAIAKGLDGTPGKENGLADDPDKDGMTNLTEFYFDGNPRASDPSILPHATLEAGYLVLSFKRRDDAEADVASQSAQYGTTLANWTTTPIGAANSTDGNGVIVTVAENGSAADDITVKIPRNSATKLFGRVEVIK